MTKFHNPIIAALFNSKDLVELHRKLLDVKATKLAALTASGLFQSDSLRSDKTPHILIQADDGRLYFTTPHGGISLEVKENRKAGKKRAHVCVYENNFIDFIATVLAKEERSRFAIKTLEEFRHVYLRAWSVLRNHNHAIGAVDLYVDVLGDGINITTIMSGKTIVDQVVRIDGFIDQDDITSPKWDRYFEFNLENNHA